MATGYRTVEQAQAAYDTVLQQKQRQQRNDYINQQQAIMGVNNYLKQQGYNGGAAESILLRTRGNRGDYSAYDAQLAELTALIQGMKSAAAAARSRQPDTVQTASIIKPSEATRRYPNVTPRVNPALGGNGIITGNWSTTR